ncbi:pseudouridine synthase [Alphaproteobacteria bacterium]|nr:pseudouridine synthase [Alphaproteobacteria bacterium]
MQNKIRIAKFIANAGFCSRREAEKLIQNKIVKINNILCLHPSDTVNENDRVSIREQLIKPINTIRLWKIYKPIKFICSTKDEHNRKKIFDLVPKSFPRIISIGRLDFMSEGLLLLTNNGDYSRNLELPSKGYERIYRVCLRGQIEKKDIFDINKGIKINNITYNRIKIKIDKLNKNFTWIIVKLQEGKNREIRNICKHFSWKIVKLIRIQFGPYKLGNLKEGQIEEIKVFKNV